MKTNNTKTTKRIAAVILAAVAAFTVMGCSVEKTVTKTETHTYTDAEGNTVTTTTTNNNGEVTTETTTVSAEEAAMALVDENVDVEEISNVEVFKSVPIEFDNEMGWDIGSFSLKMSSSDEWSGNLFSEEEYLNDGETMSGLNVSYDSEDRFIDISVADSQGDGVEFDDVELPLDNVDQILVTFCFDETDGSYFVTVE